jgi:hypothetical protein
MAKAVVRPKGLSWSESKWAHTRTDEYRTHVTELTQPEPSLGATRCHPPDYRPVTGGHTVLLPTAASPVSCWRTPTGLIGTHPHHK